VAKESSWRAVPPRGWVPTEVHFDRAPFYVKWEDLHGQLPSEPFFKQSLDRLRKEFKGTFAIRTDIKTLLNAAALPTSAVEPAGIIFHLSRCGSTLVANCLRAATEALVLSEADPFLDLLLLSVFEPDRRRCDEIEESLKAVATTFAYHRSAVANKLY